MKQSKYLFITFRIVFLTACMGKSKQPSIVFNEHSLKELVVNSHSVPEKKYLPQVDSVIENTSKDSSVFCQTISFLEKSFGDPNSAYRNEDLYTQVLQAKMKSPWYDSLAKSAIRKKLYLIMQNRPGNTANDFTYITADGVKKQMYEVKAANLLLYFYNPECDACKQMKNALSSSAVISARIKSGVLKILAIYTDRDTKIWLNHLAEMPATWINGRDEDEYLYKNSIYDLKAIPTLYLLDRNKQVVLKDCMDVSLIEKSIRLNE